MMSQTRGQCSRRNLKGRASSNIYQEAIPQRESIVSHRKRGPSGGDMGHECIMLLPIGEPVLVNYRSYTTLVVASNEGDQPSNNALVFVTYIPISSKATTKPAKLTRMLIFSPCDEGDLAQDFSTLTSILRGRVCYRVYKPPPHDDERVKELL